MRSARRRKQPTEQCRANHPNGYFLFQDTVTDRLRAEGITDRGKVTKQAKKEWSEFTFEEKKVYSDQARQIRESRKGRKECERSALEHQLSQQSVDYISPNLPASSLGGFSHGVPLPPAIQGALLASAPGHTSFPYQSTANFVAENVQRMGENTFQQGAGQSSSSSRASLLGDPLRYQPHITLPSSNHISPTRSSTGGSVDTLPTPRDGTMWGALSYHPNMISSFSDHISPACPSRSFTGDTLLTGNGTMWDESRLELENNLEMKFTEEPIAAGSDSEDIFAEFEYRDGTYVWPQLEGGPWQ